MYGKMHALLCTEAEKHFVTSSQYTRGSHFTMVWFLNENALVQAYERYMLENKVHSAQPSPQLTWSSADVQDLLPQREIVSKVEKILPGNTPLKYKLKNTSLVIQGSLEWCVYHRTCLVHVLVCFCRFALVPVLYKCRISAALPNTSPGLSGLRGSVTLSFIPEHSRARNTIEAGQLRIKNAQVDQHGPRHILPLMCTSCLGLSEPSQDGISPFCQLFPSHESSSMLKVSSSLW